MGAGMLAASLRLKSVDIATWLHVADLPILVLPLVIWGAFSTRRLIATFGMKRILILASFVLSILALGLSYSQSQLEVTLLAFGFAFAAGSIYAASLLLVSSVAPPGQMGQSIGYFYLALAWGLLAGFGLHDTVIQNFWPLAAVGLFVTGLFVLQSLSPHRAIRLNTPPESTYAVGITDLEWDGYRGPLTGLARHTFFSRVAQMLARTLAEIFFWEPAGCRQRKPQSGWSGHFRGQSSQYLYRSALGDGDRARQASLLGQIHFVEVTGGGGGP